MVIKASFSVSRLPNDSTLNYRSDAKSSNARKRSAVASLINRAEENSPQSGYVQDFQDNLRQAHQQVRQAMGTSAVAEKTYFDRRVRSYSFAVGQRVWLYWPRPLGPCAAKASQTDTSLDRTVDNHFVSITDPSRAQRYYLRSKTNCPHRSDQKPRLMQLLMQVSKRPNCLRKTHPVHRNGGMYRS